MSLILNILGSMKSMIVLMLVFAFSIGWATIIENDYGTMTAKAEIYDAVWFEILLYILTINLIINIFRYKMFSKKKAPILIFHVAFIIIAIGAFITRYIGYEGNMHIREGQSSSSLVSLESYVTFKAGDKELQKHVYLSRKSKNNIEGSLHAKGKDIDIRLVEFIPNATEAAIPDKDGKPILDLMITNGTKGEPIRLMWGDYFEGNNFILNFGAKESFSKPVVDVTIKDKKLFMSYDKDMNFLEMDTRKSGVLKADKNKRFNTRTLYGFEGSGFVLREFFPKAKIKIVSDPNASAQQPSIDALRFDVRVGDKSKEMLIYGQEGVLAEPYTKTINGVKISISYGSKEIKLPFSLYLKDFILKRYPGSMSPASYESDVILKDDRVGLVMPFRIYMNHILNYDGFRFFQASYDMDEKGTILSVNHDPGTLPTYIGYFLLTIGMLWSLISKSNRFAQLSKKAKKASMAQAVLALVVLFSFAPNLKANDSDIALLFNKSHADKFGELIIQDSGGRMKPLDTLDTEILAKLYRGANLELDGKKLDANQVVLGMMIRPDIYKNIAMIRTHNEAVNKLLGVDKDTKYVSFSTFFEQPQKLIGYKLADAVDEANRKEVKHRNKFDKAVLKIDEKVNIAYAVYTGSLIRMWPKPNDKNHKWFSVIDALQKFDKQTAQEVRAKAVAYFTAVDEALSSGDWTKADEALKNIVSYQKKYGAEVYPSSTKIKAEAFYNHVNIFETLFPYYFLVGFVLLIFAFAKIIKPTINISLISKGVFVLLVLFFIAHTFGLILRWYIAGHAPWSNGYESMIYISWATVFAGFVFSKKSPMAMASTSIMAGLILLVAHLNWMDPRITNLVPVLNSYWLSLHVAVITASYGFLGLSALLGFITLLLFVLINKENKQRLSASIKELNAINEMSIMIGLALLTIGNFLGGVWANESWGRYWGWDPKETWALVSILVYAVVVHIRFVKSIYSEYGYSIISLLAFSSIVMTYFGVNYYLAGMHSYAKGDPVPIPDFVPISYMIIFIIIIMAYPKRKLC